MSHSKKQEFVSITSVPAATKPEDIKKNREQFIKTNKEIHKQELELLHEHPGASIINYASFSGLKIGLFDKENKADMLRKLADEAKINVQNKNQEPDDSQKESGFLPLS